MRTDGTGCSSCTDPAMSCTHTASERRCASSTKCAANANMLDDETDGVTLSTTPPVPFTGGCDGRRFQMCAISARASKTPSISSDRTIDRSSTTPMSSVGSRPASLATSNSSSPMRNAIVSGTSLPRVVSMPVVDMTPRMATHRELETAATEGYLLCEGLHETSQLTLRRLLLSAGGCRAKGQKGHHRAHRRTRGPQSTQTGGVIFGSPLKSMLHASGVGTCRRPVVSATRRVARFLDPARYAMQHASGNDRVHLINGLACKRISRREARRLPELCQRECATERTFLGRNGLQDVAFGATAAVLCTHHLMAAMGADATNVSTRLTNATRRVHTLLRRWQHSTDASSSIDDDCAMYAELRAMRRAECAAAAAAARARDTGMDDASALRMQLEWMRAAAWPSHAVCDAHHQEAMCERILSEGGYAAWVEGGAETASANDDACAVPLSALSGVLAHDLERWRRDGGACSGDEEDGDGDEGRECDAIAMSARTSFASTMSSLGTPSVQGDDSVSLRDGCAPVRRRIRWTQSVTL